MAESPGKLAKSEYGDFIYYGENEFIDRIIGAWKAENERKTTMLRGVYGSVYKVSNSLNVNNKQYYVKQITPSSYKFTDNVKNILKEIELSNIANDKEYAIRPKYGDKCWNELLSFRVDEI
jgi:hypothetical protein